MEMEPQVPSNGLVRCPGCLRSSGPPGALCPYCGSTYPDPGAGSAAAFLGVVAAVGIGLALLLQGASESVAGVFGVIGVGALIGAFAMGSRAKGHVGPVYPRQTSCCGCSCLVALAVL